MSRALPADRAYGRLLVERLALEASRGPDAGTTLAADDVRGLLGRPQVGPGPTRADVVDAFEQPLARAWDALLDDLSPTGGLGRIAVGGDLGDVEVAILSLCGAVELDAELGRLCAVAHDRPTQDFVTVGLVVRALGPDALAALAPDARLRSSGLLELDPDPALTAARVRLPRTVAWALAGIPTLSPDLPAGVEVHRNPVPDPDAPRRVLVAATDRVRRTEAAVRSCRGRGFLVTPMPRTEGEWTALVRQATVDALGVVLDLSGPDQLDATARTWILRAGHLSWAICCPEPVAVGTLPVEHWTDVPAAPARASAAEWQAVFPDDPEPARRLDAAQLRLVAMVRSDGADPQSAVRRVASGVLGQHAKLVVPRVSWDELILPESHSSRLRDLVDRYRNRGRVHDDWGLPLFPSPGVVALFSGPSGTGKSTAAEIIANELGMAMYRVDLSSLVSKYVGETEKNLEELFGAAHSGDYLLLFDEADSLFGVRSAVTDAKDRYANMEVSYLLQRLETYDGFVVLTSNFPGNIDQAFLRRIHVSLHFPVPGAEDRRGMWTRSLAQAPLSADLDLDAVAAKFDLTGGSIRNAALSAAFLAAAAGSEVTTAHVVRAVTQEMTKLGRRTTDERFTPR